MALTIEFSRRSTNQLQKILSFYDERNGSDTYSRRLLRCFLVELQHLAQMPTASSPSTRPDVRFFLLDGIHYHLSIQYAEADSPQHSLFSAKTAKGISEKIRLILISLRLRRGAAASRHGR